MGDLHSLIQLLTVLAGLILGPALVEMFSK